MSNMYTVILQRKFTQNRNQQSGIEYIAQRAVGGARSRWQVSEIQLDDPVYRDGKYVYTSKLTFEKQSGHANPQLLNREWSGIKSMIAKLGAVQKFDPYPWIILQASGGTEGAQDSEESKGVEHALSENTGVTLEEVKERSLPLIDELLNNEFALNTSEFFSGIYGRNPQIRCVLSSVKSFLESDGRRRPHTVLHGDAACGKSLILQSLTAMLGADACLKLDATSLSEAGLYKIFFHELKNVPEPPIVILEEAEKTSENSLRVWLGALDDRAELRKINAREMTSRKLNILCMATVNDKQIFDKLMGGSDKTAGALSSRFVNQLYCPRPDREILSMILERDIIQNGGKFDWIEPILSLAERVNTNDPRKILSFLSGGDRLLDGTFQKDVLASQPKL